MNSPPRQLLELADALRPALHHPNAGPPKPSIALAQFAVWRHRVGALLDRSWSNALEQEGEHTSEIIAVRDYLARHLDKMTRRELRQKAASKRFRPLLEAEGVASREIKGWRLGEELYGRSTLRASKDVDLLVSPENFEAAIDLAADNGYLVAGERGPEGARRARRIARYHREISIFDRDLNTEIELHSRTLGEPPSGWRDLRVEHGDRSALEDPDYILYLIIHGAVTGWKRMKWLCDLAMIVEKTDADIRAIVIARSDDLDFAPALLASLMLGKELWPDCPIEPWVGELRVDPGDERVQAHLGAFRRRLAQTEAEPLPKRVLRHAQIIRDPPVFGHHPSRIRVLRSNAMLWLLWKL
ncbi:nucleotidyltransferase family protein [Aurantiacibacter sediminis]|uniref:Nucleotidyltransferase family protein n=1 Tax=Aurantiacibacter sediminis TaxID=2793064 RepID=A0ABS0N5V9_9SPHN|nr:nucleotidyltransferase family protein [Aurantiacibacter sediminis]MBH5323158.1 nucleotidyltransferase family protein [Aurantiacibacter sediminis]